MKEPHLPTSRDEIDTELNKLKVSLSVIADRAEQLGEDRERVEFFDVLRELIREKDADGDSIAVEVLSWAYERLSNSQAN